MYSKIVLSELNKINKAITFTAEEENESKIPILDCFITRTKNNTIETDIYKKETHRGQYSNFYTTNQPLSVRLSTIKSLTRRANTICSKESDKEKELQYINRKMQLNDYTKPLVKKTKINSMRHDVGNKTDKVNSEIENNKKLYLPYEKGIAEKISRIAARYSVAVIHINNTSLKNRVNYKRRQANKTEEQGVVYEVYCKDCEKVYIGETGRQLNTRLIGHKKGAHNIDDNKISGLSYHIKNTGHNTDWKSPKILFKENSFIKRNFKEGLAIKRCEGHSMNKKEETKIISDMWENLL